MHRTVLLLFWLPASRKFFGAAARSRNLPGGFKLVDKTENTVIREEKWFREKD